MKGKFPYLVLSLYAAIALIVSGVSANTLRNYRFWSREVEAWLNGRSFDDGLLAEYITGLHQQGKSPATIGQAVAAVRWQAKNAGVEVIGEIRNIPTSGVIPFHTDVGGDKA